MAIEMNHSKDQGIIDRALRAIGWGRSEDVRNELLHDPNLLDIIARNPEILNKFPNSVVASIAIASAQDYDNLVNEERISEANSHLSRSLAITNFLYGRTGQHQSPIYKLIDTTTESGSIGVIEPNREYPQRGSSHYLIKLVDQKRGRQTLRDSRHFQPDPNFKLEHIVANLPRGDGNSFLWKEFIPGPNLGDLFRSLDSSIQRLGEDSEDARLLSAIEQELSDIAIKRVIHWQENSPELFEKQNPESVVNDYKKNLSKAAYELYKNSKENFNAKAFEENLESLNWGILNRNTIVRKADATFRNMILLTGKINTDYTRLLEMFTVINGGGKRKIKKYSLDDRLHFVDPPAKYSHLLEDPWEMRLTKEGGSKSNAVRRIVDHYKEKGEPIQPYDVHLMGAYRAYRKAYLVLIHFMSRNDEMLQSGAMTLEGPMTPELHQRKLQWYQTYISHLLGEGKEQLEKLSKYVPAEKKDGFNKFATTLWDIPYSF